MFPKLFRRCKGEDKVSCSDKLKQTLDMFGEKQIILQKKISMEVDRAKEYSKANNKQGVVECIKRKKFYEGKMEQLGAFQSRIRDQEQKLSQKMPFQSNKVQQIASKSKTRL